MPYWPPDTPPEVPPQMPQAATPGPAPVPYGGPGMALAPVMLAPVPDVSATLDPGHQTVHGTPGHVAEAPWAAPNVNPYEAGAISPIHVHEDADPGGRDNVAGSAADAVSNAMARLAELQSDTHGQGSRIGDLMAIPPLTSDGKHTTGGGYYDPPRDYDGGQL